ncbi:MAG: hypothetical protein Q4F02_04395 [Candidatus Saccharibacteria bacterium]|nr:hypothetical protein [Candidatus Saccharibacteria bacterium]
MAYRYKELTEEESQALKTKYATDDISPISPADMVSDDSKKYQLIGLMAGRDGVPYIALAILDGREIVIEYDHVQYGRDFDPNKRTWKVVSIYASPNRPFTVRNDIHDFMKKHKKQVLQQISSLVVSLESQAFPTSMETECLIDESLIR